MIPRLPAPCCLPGTAKDSRASWAPTRLNCSCTRWPDQHPLAATHSLGDEALTSLSQTFPARGQGRWVRDNGANQVILTSLHFQTLVIVSVSNKARKTCSIAFTFGKHRLKTSWPWGMQRDKKPSGCPQTSCSLLGTGCVTASLWIKNKSASETVKWVTFRVNPG